MKAEPQATRDDIQFATIEEALEDIAAGKMIVVVDDEDRENEGDVVMAAEFTTADDINFMTRQAGGWICLTLTPERCEELGLELMSLEERVRARDAVHRDDRGARGRDDGHLDRRPGDDDPHRGRSRPRARPTSWSPATSIR